MNDGITAWLDGKNPTLACYNNYFVQYLIESRIKAAKQEMNDGFPA